MTHAYETGRLDLPFVGIATFGKNPYQPDWTRIEADVAFLGAPFDFGTQWRAGARFGPRSVREASTLFSFGHAGAYDHEDDVTYLDGVRIVDLGDADIVHTDTERSHANIEAGVRAIEAHVHGLATQLIHGLEELGATVVTPRDSTQRGPLVCVRSTDVGALVSTLATERIVVSSREDNLRVALHLYNVEDDVETLLAALARNRSLLA